MNILFLTMSSFTSLDIHNIYTDLMKELIKNGHHPYIVVPCEKRTGEHTELIDKGDHHFLKVSVGNMTNVSFLEKGFSTVTLSNKFLNAIMKYLNGIKIDLILYSTPPITLADTIAELKKKWNCHTYLMLKDIFPQNAVDLGIIKKYGLINFYFRKKEKMLYRLSDWIGCMSDENINYLKKKNPEIPDEKIELCPNAICPEPIIESHTFSEIVRRHYGIPLNSVVFMYGGNLGKPQGVYHIAECLKRIDSLDEAFTVICGTGSEFSFLDRYVKENDLKHVILVNGLPKRDYDKLLSVCDVGLVFLDFRFTIPNFQSRILSYMEKAKPVITCTDSITDIGELVKKNGFGWSCLSNNVDAYYNCCTEAIENRDSLKTIGMKGRVTLCNEYNVSSVKERILKHIINS